jgi:glucokinase
MTTRVMAVCIGVDIGGSKIHVGAVDREGRIHASRRAPTSVERGIAAVVETIGILAEQCVHEAGAPALGVGVGVAGQIDTKTGIVRSSPNLKSWIDVPLARFITDRVRAPTVITNDMRSIVRGEWRFGAGRGVDDLVVLFVGTGVGGAVIAGGRLLLGAGGYAGELGHTPIAAGGRKCRCPGRGCVEAYVSGWALAQRAAEQLALHPEHAAAFGGPGVAVTARELGVAYAAGDELAKALVAETADYLAATLVGITNTFNPSRIVIGGGVLDGLPDLVTAAERGLRRDAIIVSRDQVEIVRSTLGSAAGVIGAASWAWDEIAARGPT